MIQPNAFDPFVESIRAEYPLAEITVEALPSGNIWCDIVLDAVWIEVQFEPSLGFGVSVFEGDTVPIPFTAPDYFFSERQPALSFIFQSLRRKW